MKREARNMKEERPNRKRVWDWIGLAMTAYTALSGIVLWFSIIRGDLSGIPLWQGLLAPVLVFFSEDGLTLAVLSVFLFVIAAAFQVMNDVGGIRALVDRQRAFFRSGANSSPRAAA